MHDYKITLSCSESNYTGFSPYSRLFLLPFTWIFVLAKFLNEVWRIGYFTSIKASEFFAVLCN